MKIHIGVSDEHKRDPMSWVLAIVMSIILFIKLKKWVAPYTHIFAVYKDRMYHSIERGLCDDCWVEYKKTHYIRGFKKVELFCTEEEFFDFYRNFKGRPYTYLQFLTFIPVIGNTFLNKLSRMWCSEWISLLMFVMARRYEFENHDKTTPAIFEKI